MVTNREKYTIIFALDNPIAAQMVAGIFGELLTRHYGGCTITRGNGYWAKDGELDVASYGEQMVEQSQKVEVVTMDEQGDHIKVLFTKAANRALKLYDVVTKDQWIHFEHTRVYCEHFQI
jgi:hypothetical protein